MISIYLSIFRSLIMFIYLTYFIYLSIYLSQLKNYSLIYERKRFGMTKSTKINIALNKITKQQTLI